MPRIDVSELMTDPDFAGRYPVRRSTSVVGEDGRARAQIADLDFVGSVQPASSSALKRLPDGAVLSGAIMVFTKFILTEGSIDNALDADVVMFKGLPYTVMAVDDWSEWGQGFVRAVCTLSANVRQE